MPEVTVPADVIDDPEPVIGGTLFLMSAFQERPCPLVARKIAYNLQILSIHPCCGEALRRLCGRMLRHWAVDDADIEAAGGQPPPATRADDAPAEERPAQSPRILH